MSGDWRSPFREWFGEPSANAVWRGLHLAEIELDHALRSLEPGILMICGASGAGKNRLVTRVLKRRHLTAERLDVSSEKAMVEFAWRNGENRLMLIDEADSLLRSENMLNRLKQMTDPYGALHMKTRRSCNAPRRVRRYTAKASPVRRYKNWRAPR
jgi:hypothetical protein